MSIPFPLLALFLSFAHQSPPFSLDVPCSRGGVWQTISKRNPHSLLDKKKIVKISCFAIEPIPTTQIWIWGSPKDFLSTIEVKYINIH